MSGEGTYLTDTPVFELFASGMVSGASLTLGGFASPLRVSTLDNVLISDLFMHVIGSMLDTKKRGVAQLSFSRIEAFKLLFEIDKQHKISLRYEYTLPSR